MRSLRRAFACLSLVALVLALGCSSEKTEATKPQPVTWGSFELDQAAKSFGDKLEASKLVADKPSVLLDAKDFESADAPEKLPDLVERVRDRLARGGMVTVVGADVAGQPPAPFLVQGKISVAGDAQTKDIIITILLVKRKDRSQVVTASNQFRVSRQ